MISWFNHLLDIHVETAYSTTFSNLSSVSFIFDPNHRYLVTEQHLLHLRGTGTQTSRSIDPTHANPPDRALTPVNTINVPQSGPYRSSAFPCQADCIRAELNAPSATQLKHLPAVKSEGTNVIST
ncbi:hypothetical protein AC579_3721 [Pseudocercospora musae]|uniref:Uncharacterized protein n=1 Tax=Pseudocercospora musae TaxID=113226 RepID=A0A139IIX1_9PEZI|nr:hypothetical protein AC579_3721 [Pseudocercospora musae]